MIDAPGAPGLPPRWTEATKTGVGTSLGPTSVWFTIGQGIVNEVYFPRVDRPAVRDLGMVITGPSGFFSEEKRHTEHEQSYLTPGVPAYRLVNTCRQGRYRLTKEIITDPARDVLLQRTRFEPLRGELGDYHAVALLAPRLGNRGYDNTAWVGDYKGVPMVFARGEGACLALASGAPLREATVGFVGVSDAWQELVAGGEIRRPYQRAEKGNLGLATDVDLAACGGEFVLAVGFGRTPEEAGNRALASLNSDFDRLLGAYTEDWEAWHQQFRIPEEGNQDLHQTSLMVLKVHEGKDFPGGLVASLSIPWGGSKGDEEIGGYHLVWPRDLVLAAGAHLAAGSKTDVEPVLSYLQATQEPDGSWPQNMWMDGAPHWSGVQLDETALPILLVDLALRHGAVSDVELAGLWPMVRKAAGFLVRSGPITPQDRWEENAGYTPFTLASMVAALLAAADTADRFEPEVSGYLRDTADFWNDSIDRWTYAVDTELARQVGVEGYYVRIAPPDAASGGSLLAGPVYLRNRPEGHPPEQAFSIVSPDALALVRFGLRHPDDPKIVSTVRVIDELLAVDTPAGTGYRRYNGDGYGEHPDGAAYEGTGIGRLWPLLTAERAHYELAAGNLARARELAAAVARFANEGGMLPEQVWDSDPIPERRLYPGQATGAATPLVWAHGEYIKLLRSLEEGVVFDLPPQPMHRYLVDRVPPRVAVWRPDARLRSVRAGRVVRIELMSPDRVRWDFGRRTGISKTVDVGFGVHTVELPAAEPGATVRFVLDSAPAKVHTIRVG